MQAALAGPLGSLKAASGRLGLRSSAGTFASTSACQASGTAPPGVQVDSPAHLGAQVAPAPTCGAVGCARGAACALGHARLCTAAQPLLVKGPAGACTTLVPVAAGTGLGQLTRLLERWPVAATMQTGVAALRGSAANAPTAVSACWRRSGGFLFDGCLLDFRCTFN